LRYVKQLSKHWLHLRLLADFMQISTVPQRWKDLEPVNDPKANAKRQREREDRARRTKVCRLDYTDAGKVRSETFVECESLQADVQAAPSRAIDSDVKLRLYVVEDLSRDVIELLGDNLAIEPAFFRAHVVDFAWYNVRDRWRDPPSLDVVRRSRNWVQIRYVTSRYFETGEEFDRAKREADSFNILRRPDDDLSNNAWWDDTEHQAVVGLTRSRATFWLKPGSAPGTPVIGE
jgi:hypothetical protein